jgi:putative flippase GtrA
MEMKRRGQRLKRVLMTLRPHGSVLNGTLLMILRVLNNGAQKFVFKFLCVGFINTIVDIGVLNFLLFLAGNSVSVAMFIFMKSCAFIFAVTNSYILNSRWVFVSTNSLYTRKKHSLVFSKFLGVNIVALGMNVSVAASIYTFVTPVLDNYYYAATVSAVAGSIMGIFINFNGYKKYCFGDI